MLRPFRSHRLFLIFACPNDQVKRTRVEIKRSYAVNRDWGAGGWTPYDSPYNAAGVGYDNVTTIFW